MTTVTRIQYYFNKRKFQNITLFKSRQSWNFVHQTEHFYKDFMCQMRTWPDTFLLFPTADRLSPAVNHLINYKLS